MKTLLIVESPTKAKTISKFLNSKEFAVASSFGHIRDLPKSIMGIDVEHEFTPQYVIPKDKQKIVTELKKKAQSANLVLLATDHDREGEAIAWHLLHALELNGTSKKVKRIVFHEITKEAIEHAVQEPLTVDSRLVDAQQARRILDRLVGYELSPFLWKTVARGLSAGRVQSAATRLIVEREQEIKAFDAQEYWSVSACFDTAGSAQHSVKPRIIKSGDQDTDDKKEKIAPQNNNQFIAKLHSVDDAPLDKFAFPQEDKAREILTRVVSNTYKVRSIEQKSLIRKPQPPFTTSTLQQIANRRLGFSAKQTMFIAQKLYEGIELGNQGSQGLITYMRTDSVTLSEKFLNESRIHIRQTYGATYVPNNAVLYKTKSRNAQEAHEAIRPTSVAYTPESIQQYLDNKTHKLYTLIWQRAVASQMKPAKINSLTVDISGDNKCIFRATGQTVAFDGFMKVYPSDTKELLLPELKTQQSLSLADVQAQQHFTQPPARYSEATLVKKLEELGIGRPSTYAPIISTIQNRNYVEKEGRNLKPTEMGEVVNQLLVKHFPEVVDYQFTAQMENELDDIASGKQEWTPVIKEFYDPFKKHLEKKKTTVSKKDLQETTDEQCEKCGKAMVIKFGRFGKFLACSGFPECKNSKPLSTGNENGEPGANEPPEDLGECPECKKPLMRRHGRYGPFISCSGYPDCKYIQKKKAESTGVKCPTCKEGDIVEKRTRRGKLFYACSRYPDCDQAYWNKPTGEQCPDCKEILLFAAKGKIKCSNKECGYEKDSADKDTK